MKKNIKKKHQKKKLKKRKFRKIRFETYRSTKEIGPDAYKKKENKFKRKTKKNGPKVSFQNLPTKNPEIEEIEEIEADTKKKDKKN